MASFNKKSLYKPALLSEKSPDIVTPRQAQPVPSPIAPTPPPPSQSLSLSDGEGSLLTGNDNTLTQLSFNNSDSIVPIDGKSVISTRVTQDLSSLPSNTNTQIPVSVIKLPSPVRVVRHSPPPSLPSFPPPPSSRRFSNDFVQQHPLLPLSPPSPPSIKEEEEENEDGILTERGEEKGREGQGGMSLKESLIKGDDLSSCDDDTESVTTDDIKRLLGNKEVISSEESEDDSEKPISQQKSDVSIKKNKKKVNSRVVPSRYMETSSCKKGPLPPSLSQSLRTGKLNQSRLNTTLKDLSFHPSQAFTSTPAVKGPHPLKSRPQQSMRPHPLQGSNRTIGGERPTVGKTKKSIAQNLPTGGVIAKRNGTAVATRLDPSSTQSLLYVRLLQMTYLNIKAHKAKKEQEESAYSQLYTLWEACQMKSQEVAQLKRELEYSNRMNSMDYSIERQLGGLKELHHKLSLLSPYHSTLSEAIYTTLHELPTKDIHISSNSLSDLIEAMTKAEVSSSEVASTIKDITPQVTSLAHSVKSLSEVVEKEQEILQKVKSQLNTITQKQVHETSLYYEKLQTQLHP